MNHCAIDFGTSNSGLALPDPGVPGRTRLVPIEDGLTTMPTAVFYFTDDDEARSAQGVHHPDGALPRAHGRAAIRAYVDGNSGRLMRSLKSILGSGLAEQATDLGQGHSVRYLDVLAGYLRHLRSLGEANAQNQLTHVVLGRPVHFVDDDAQRDALAQTTLERAARAAGFTHVHFQFEPIAAAFDYEQRIEHEQIVLVADIGGGTSDFSVVRVGPARRGRVQRRDDILANHGVHIAGTDFDRHIELEVVLPLLGFRARGPVRGARPPEATDSYLEGQRALRASGPVDHGAREVPGKVYFDLATWHLINTVYRPARVAELRGMADWYADKHLHARLMRAIDWHLGHDLAARSEAAKIAAASGHDATVDLGAIEGRLTATLSQAQAVRAIDADLLRIVDAAVHTVREAGLEREGIDALYFTGGSTGLASLTQRLEQAFPQAQAVHGERLASVATGLGVHAARLFG
jgi:hypothetical chaperone protein